MTDTPMTPERDPSRREELLFMLLHGGARDAAIAQRVVDLALAEARAELVAARPSRFSATPAEVDAFLRQHLAEDTYLSFQQAIGAHALEEAGLA
ncbi:hypothetical protein [Streptomyces cyaneofuscatus]|uniref:hypothetical protein n=1 Tax=Streptomyces cyaneofuscatus TaxID=66883 RepID=UPI003663B39A